MTQHVRTRFAPSPTGFLHIGGARTALFNWLFARHMGGQFLLRIEDTDKVRSTSAATQAIFDSLTWLGLTWDEPAVFQSARIQRHQEVVAQLLEGGHAYRDGDVVRFKTPPGQTTFSDAVMGSVTVSHDQLTDLILLRSDASPTYNLAVVADDHDMGITHVIRGSDHISNTPKQVLLYQAMGWPIPSFTHVPMILGADGAKLSKRHGALGTMSYKDMGYLPEALKNYLARLGWAHGDDEIFSMEQAISWFSLSALGKAPARFDIAKLDYVNGVYLRCTPPEVLVQAVIDQTGQTAFAQGIRALLPEAVQRAKTLVELANMVAFLWTKPAPSGTFAQLDVVVGALESCLQWDSAGVEQALASTQIPLKQVAGPLRLALTGARVSLPLFVSMAALGRRETLARLKDAKGEGSCA